MKDSASTDQPSGASEMSNGDSTPLSTSEVSRAIRIRSLNEYQWRITSSISALIVFYWVALCTHRHWQKAVQPAGQSRRQFQLHPPRRKEFQRSTSTPPVSTEKSRDVWSSFSIRFCVRVSMLSTAPILNSERCQTPSKKPDPGVMLALTHFSVSGQRHICCNHF